MAQPKYLKHGNARERQKLSSAPLGEAISSTKSHVAGRATAVLANEPLPSESEMRAYLSYFGEVTVNFDTTLGDYYIARLTVQAKPSIPHSRTFGIGGSKQETLGELYKKILSDVRFKIPKQIRVPLDPNNWDQNILVDAALADRGTVEVWDSYDLTGDKTRRAGIAIAGKTGNERFLRDKKPGIGDIFTGWGRTEGEVKWSLLQHVSRDGNDQRSHHYDYEKIALLQVLPCDLTHNNGSFIGEGVYYFNPTGTHSDTDIYRTNQPNKNKALIQLFDDLKSQDIFVIKVKNVDTFWFWDGLRFGQIVMEGVPVEGGSGEWKEHHIDDEYPDHFDD